MSAFLLQQAAWSPKTSNGCVQKEHKTSPRATLNPRRYRTAVRNTCGDRQQSDPSRLDGTAVTHAPACSANKRVSLWWSRLEDSATRREWMALSIAREA